MATILFAAAGAALGAGFGGTVLGLSGAVLGKAVGATVGRAVDQRIIGLGSDAVEVGKLDRFHVMGASEGAPIAKFWGRMRLAGQVIWASSFRETSQKSGGKGMPSPKTVQFSYSVSLAIALCEGEILGIGRIWADGDEISPRSLNIRVYTGTEDQLPDALIEAQLGVSLAPCYRGTAYVVIEELDLSAYGNRVPQFSFEVMRRAQGVEAEKVSDLQDAIRAVALIPGTGEYSLATQKLYEKRDFGASRAVNVNSPSGDTDLVTSLHQLKTELPNCTAVSLVVSWFGSDLRCGYCNIQPKVEQKEFEIDEMPWRSGGIERSAALEVPRVDGRSIYGGTPADAAVIEAIAALRDSGHAVMFYPFILMDQVEGNGFADPYSENGFQAALPWRGRITLSIAQGRDGSPDQTDLAISEVSAFFGNAQVSDFWVQNGDVHYTGQSEWGYRRFILHYATLCQLAGGVESFCIGSEMRELTKIRGPEHRFPAVEALVQLAADVRLILGPNTKISYAADWTEYFGFHDGDNVFFHLDPLWASDAIDFIGIDNYMPISDWRDAENHADANWRSIYSIDYLKFNISGGEGFDWYYAGQEEKDRQARTPIKDLAYGEDWVFRCKDLRSWWSELHYNRIDGVRSGQPTDWVPQSKPIRFTEYGCAAIDKGTNEPNKFIDARSSEAGYPHASQMGRDDLIQMQYFCAVHEYWSDPANNPASNTIDGLMLDLKHCYAWAWDARPYPEFPRNTYVWSDGENYNRGHWLNGRAVSAPLDRIVREVLDDVGVKDVDTTRLFGVVHGYGIADTQSARSRLQPLEVTYGFDSFEDEGILRLQSRGVSEVAEVSLDEVVLSGDGSAEFEAIRTVDQHPISRLRFSYINADGSFTVAISEAASSETISSSTIETEYSIVLPVGTGKATARRWLAEVSLAQEQLSICLAISRLPINAGSLIRVNGQEYRVDSCDVGNKVTLKAVRFEPSLYNSFETDFDALSWDPHIEAGPISRIWMNLPLINSSQSPYASFLAVSSDPWLRQAILWSSDQDADYSLNSIFERPSHIGKTLTGLAACQIGLLDRGPELLIKLNTGEVESTSLGGLLSGRNLVAIGDGSLDRWEIFQFMHAELRASNVYGVSFRLRGMFGSDVNMQETWPAGSHVVLIDSQLEQISLYAEQLNMNRHYRIGFSDQAIGSNVMTYDVIAHSGAGLRPYSVGHLSFSMGDDNSHNFQWKRRGRIGGDSWDGYEVPLGEERELYLFVARSSEGTVLVNKVVTQPSFSYSSNHRLDTGASESYLVEVSQISVEYGAGPKTTLIVGT